ncbi:MAG: glycosyltransferase family 10 [Candidatus Diapherotrites archaeon]
MKKKTIKINFKYFWEGFNPENNFLTNTLRNLYDVKISENPDYLFYSVYQEIKTSGDLSKKGDFIRRISPKLYILLREIYSKISNFSIKDKFPLPEGNFVKIFFGSELIKPNMNKCGWAFSEYPEEEINNPRHMKLIIIVNDYQLKNFGIPTIKKKINFNKIKKEKTEFCNFIYARDIAKRNDFFKELSKYKKIDAPGRCMNNMPPIRYNSPKESRISASCVIDKLNFIKKYKFTTAFENSSRSGYISEKLTHPMLVNSIPIYFGHKDVNKEFNTKSFINYNDFKNMKEFIKYIIKVDNDDKLYEKILREPWYNDNKPPRDLDIRRIQKRFKEIIESKK